MKTCPINRSCRSEIFLAINEVHTLTGSCFVFSRTQHRISGRSAVVKTRPGNPRDPKFIQQKDGHPGVCDGVMECDMIAGLEESLGSIGS